MTGVETIAHLRENGRITLLFNAFEGPPPQNRKTIRDRYVTGLFNSHRYRHIN